MILAQPKMKCEKYWPDVNKSEKYGHVTVQGISQESSNIAPFTTIRTFKVNKGKITS